MAATRAKVNPKVLRWAREAAGFDVASAASKVQKDPATLSAWERGDEQPTVRQARLLARAYKRPLATFFLSAVPATPGMPRDFRRVSADRAKTYSPELRLAIRSALYRQQWLRERAAEFGNRRLAFVGSWKQPTRHMELAAKIRSALRVSTFPSNLRKQEAFRRWADAIEMIDVSVMQGWSFDATEARGFALPDAFAPVIFVNTRDTAGARIFTLIHELVHIYLGASGVSDPIGTGEYPAGVKRIEVFCNRVAAEVLVPAQAFDKLLRTVPPGERPNETAAKLARHFAVGEEVIARRLLDRRLISQADYESLRRIYIEAWKSRTRREPEQRGGLPAGRRTLASVGTRFAGAVTRALGEGDVSPRDATLLLNMDLSKIGDLEQELRAARSRRRSA